MDKILTIIIPTYNMEKYLRHCLDSLIVPNMGKVEVLVINDGSKDSSSTIAHEYQDKYPQTFRVIDKENGNYGSCINRGLKEATGKYIRILDADDSYNPIEFDKFIEKLFQVNADLVLTDFNIVDEKGHITNKYCCKELYNIEIEKNIRIETFLKVNPTFNGQMHGITYKRSIFDEMDYKQHEGISYTDTQWCFEPMTKVNDVLYIPLIVYVYLVGRAGQTMKNQGKHIKDMILVAKDMLSFYENKDWKQDVYSQYFSRKILGMLQSIYSLGLYQKAYNINILRGFDDELSKIPIFYEKSSLLTIHHLKLVKYWRCHGKKFLPFWISIYKIIQEVYKYTIYKLFKNKSAFLF